MSLDDFTSAAGAAAGVAYAMLAHSADFAGDLQIVRHHSDPEGLYAEDLWSFVWNIIEEATKAGYVFAKAEDAIRSIPRYVVRDQAVAPVEVAARTVAAILGLELVEDQRIADMPNV